MAGNFFRGTSVDQDGRWGRSDQRLMAKMSKTGKFAPILDTKVNTKKVNIDVMSKWISQRIIEIVDFEDDILINLVINMIQSDNVDPKKLQLDVTGFLEKQAPSFVEELWTLLVDAQDQPTGIPSALIKRKKEEILQRQLELQAAAAAAAMPPPSSALAATSAAVPRSTTGGKTRRWGPSADSTTDSNIPTKNTSTSASTAPNPSEEMPRSAEVPAAVDVQRGDPEGDNSRHRGMRSKDIIGHQGRERTKGGDEPCESGHRRGHSRSRSRSRSKDRHKRARRLDESTPDGHPQDSHRSSRRDRERDRGARGRSGDRHWVRDRDGDRSRDRVRDRDRDRDRDRSRDRDWGSDRGKDRGSDRDGDRDRVRKRDGDLDRGRDREKGLDRDGDRGSNDDGDRNRGRKHREESPRDHHRDKDDQDNRTGKGRDTVQSVADGERSKRNGDGRIEGEAEGEDEDEDATGGLGDYHHHGGKGKDKVEEGRSDDSLHGADSREQECSPSKSP